MSRQASSSAVNFRVWRLLVGVAIICGLYFLQEILLPVAVAALITFVTVPAVSRLESYLGRTLSVILTAALVFLVIGVIAWICTVQIFDLALKLPTYRANLTAKVQALNASGGGPLGSVATMLQEIEEETGSEPDTAAGVANGRPFRVEVIDRPQAGPARIWAFASTIFGPIGSIGLVAILTIFMLLRHDDLRDRIISLVGKGRIGETTGAMRDASQRVYQFLRMNLLVNVCYGVPVAAGLYFIGVPGALLWGFLATVLRFIPYIGPLIGMALPVALSLAVFDNWSGPLLTIGLFIGLELIINNVLEPWLYGSSTGISSLALIVAALFWTWLWGPVGLVLSTPLTVCLLVVGKNIPQLSFLGILLSHEGALTAPEMSYHRLLAGDRAALNRIVDEQSKTESLDSVYGTTLLPALGMVEADLRRHAIDSGQHQSAIETLRELVDQLGFRVENAGPVSPLPEVLPGVLPAVSLRIVCTPADSAADEVASAMLAQVARAHGFEAEVTSSKNHVGEICTLIQAKSPDWVWVCAVNPRGLSRCRHLCIELRKQIPDLRLSFGIWEGQEDLAGTLPGLEQSGAESVSTVFGESLLRMEALRSSFSEAFSSAPIPDNEAHRLSALIDLGLLNQGRDELLDRTTTELTKIFEVPIALVSLVDSGWQHFASQCGLPEDLAAEGRTGRDVSVCGHVVAANRPLIIEDLARDRRFAGNPLLRQRNLRFYAGVPLRTSAGMPIGSLCILDTRPRTISEREVRLMQMIAEGLMVEIEARAGTNRPPQLAAEDPESDTGRIPRQR